MRILKGTIIFIGFLFPQCFTLTPLSVAKSVSQKIFSTRDIFWVYEYGGAIIFDGLYLTDSVFHTNYTAILDSWLDAQLNDQNSVAYCVIHNKYFPNVDALGDIVGLFPINYLGRLQRENVSFVGGYNRTLYWSLINTTANNYVLGWPETLPDGTFSRHDHGEWTSQPADKASFVWADDQYMGLTLLARLAIANDDKITGEFVAKELVQFSKYLYDPQDQLQYHGYNFASKEHSCCKWGRANGWGLMAHVEVLNALDSINQLQQSAMREQVLDTFRRHVEGMIRMQSADGRWHQVLDAKETYLETSVTSMTLYALTRGVLLGWIYHTNSVERAIVRGWEGLQKAILQDGEVTGICRGTGIGNDVDFYENRESVYLTSSPGLGSVLYATAWMQKYMDTYARHVNSTPGTHRQAPSVTACESHRHIHDI